MGKNKLRPKEYSPQLKSFALNLNFYSNCLSHQRTIATWYSNIDCSPGFTTQAFIAIKHAVDFEKNLGTDIHIC